MDKPTITPETLASLLEDAPTRLVRKLEKKPDTASAWTWSCEDGVWTIATDRDETVRLSPTGGQLHALEQIACSCLLAPRCLHILAVLRQLEIAQPDASDAASSPETPDEPGATPAPDEELVLTKPQRDAARAVWSAGASLLDHGALHTRLALQTELLRAVHSCRVLGLYRLAAAGLRVAESVRQLQASSASFALEPFVENCREMLTIAHALAESDDTLPAPRLRGLIGRARREYHPLGNLRLHGLLCEPVVARTGYAGVAVTLVDDDGAMWTLSDIRPGVVSRVAGAYRGAISVGDTHVRPDELVRSGLMLQKAAGSDDGRLSTGKNVRAVRAQRRNLDGPPYDRFWNEPLSKQIERAWSALELDALERPAGRDFLFLDATILGTNKDSLVVSVDDEILLLDAPYTLEALAYRDNLRILARAPGLRARIIARMRTDGAPVALAACAVQPDDEKAPKLLLPESWDGLCNLGLDRLQGGHIDGILPGPFEVMLDAARRPPDPLAALRRRIQRAAYGGRATLQSATFAAIEAESATLQRRMMTTGAALLHGLAEAALPDARTLTGESRITNPHRLARAWLAAATYERAARLQTLA